MQIYQGKIWSELSLCRKLGIYKNDVYTISKLIIPKWWKLKVNVVAPLKIYQCEIGKTQSIYKILYKGIYRNQPFPK